MSYRFFQNKECEYFPCKSTEDDLNCLFCFCPIYHVDCKGNYTYTDKGIKDCSNCVIPHGIRGYEIVVSILKEINDETKANCS